MRVELQQRRGAATSLDAAAGPLERLLDVAPDRVVDGKPDYQRFRVWLPSQPFTAAEPER